MQTKPTLYLLFNHKLTSEQEEDAYLNLGVERIVYLPDSLLAIWKNISPKKRYLKDLLYPIYSYMYSRCTKGDYILIQGDSGATYQVVQKAFSLKLKPIYATTERKAVEKNVEGKNIKTSEFEHVIYREYGE